MRWRAVALGTVAALGMEVALLGLVDRAGAASGPLRTYGVQFVALVLGGFVAGHLAYRWEVLHGVGAAVGHILVSTTITAVREYLLASQAGLVALPPLDLVHLAVSDFVALTGASLGGRLAEHPPAEAEEEVADGGPRSAGGQRRPPNGLK